MNLSALFPVAPVHPAPRPERNSGAIPLSIAAKIRSEADMKAAKARERLAFMEWLAGPGGMGVYGVATAYADEIAACCAIVDAACARGEL